MQHADPPVHHSIPIEGTGEGEGWEQLVTPYLVVPMADGPLGAPCNTTGPETSL